VETGSRDRILNSAEQLIAEKGYAAASISGIAEASGSPPGSIYWYFGSKGGVLSAVLQRGAQRFFTDVQELTPAGVDPEEALRDWLSASAAVIRRHPLFLRISLQMMLSGVRHSERQGAAVTMREGAREAVRAAIADTYRPWGCDTADRIAEHVTDLALTFFDGLFVAAQFDSEAGVQTDRARLIAQSASAIHHHALLLRNSA
jgi:AcrR family transcriptional regulator